MYECKNVPVFKCASVWDEFMTAWWYQCMNKCRVNMFIEVWMFEWVLSVIVNECSVVYC